MSEAGSIGMRLATPVSKPVFPVHFVEWNLNESPNPSRRVEGENITFIIGGTRAVQVKPVSPAVAPHPELDPAQAVAPSVKRHPPGVETGLKGRIAVLPLVRDGSSQGR